MSQCKKCPTEIKWVTTAGGQLMPIDAKPVTGFTNETPGLFVLDEAKNTVRIRQRDREEDKPPFYVSHFATCPHAGSFKK